VALKFGFPVMFVVAEDFCLVLQVAEDAGRIRLPLLGWLGVLEEVLEEPPDHRY
jgi:hypothetical protein